MWTSKSEPYNDSDDTECERGHVAKLPHGRLAPRRGVLDMILVAHGLGREEWRVATQRRSIVMGS